MKKTLWFIKAIRFSSSMFSPTPEQLLGPFETKELAVKSSKALNITNFLVQAIEIEVEKNVQ